MALIEHTKRVLRTQPDASTLYECRVCGTSQFAPMGSCSSCGSTDIVEFSFE